MLKISLAQVNPILGDLHKNAEKIRQFYQQACNLGSSFVVFPAGALAGAYHTTLFNNPEFIEDVQKVASELQNTLPNIILSENLPCFTTNNSSLFSKVNVLSVADKFNKGSYHQLYKNLFGQARIGNKATIYCNLVGGNVEDVYFGGSLVLSPDGKVLLAAKLFEEDLLTFDLNMVSALSLQNQFNAEVNNKVVNELIISCICLAIKDYVEKNNFPGVLISSSGGIDSALVIALAVKALGPDRVHTVTMPSKFTSSETLKDAKRLAENLNIACEEISIQELPDVIYGMLPKKFALNENSLEDITGQNIQARLRGLLTMAIANKNNYLVLNCSNKSESMVGYSTLYGDMVGGFSPIKDVWKTLVWDLSKSFNNIYQQELIPNSIIARIPSAELRNNQEDRQSLPDYPELDFILTAMLEEGKTYRELLNAGVNKSLLDKVIGLYYRSEFKRKQSAPGPMFSSAANINVNPPLLNYYKPWQ